MEGGPGAARIIPLPTCVLQVPSIFGTWVTTDLNRPPPAKILSSTATFKINRNPLKMQTIIFFANFAVNSRQSLHWNHLLEESVLTRPSLALLPRRPKKEAGAG